MEFILNYEGNDLHELLSCFFSVELERYGEKTTVELKENGANIPVTQENKQEYVKLYIEWLFEKSVATQFKYFKNGFYKLYSGEFMTNCDPEELELLICGNPTLDFKELEKITQYEGYTKDSPPVL